MTTSAAQNHCRTQLEIIFRKLKKILTFAHPFWGKLCLIVNEKV